MNHAFKKISSQLIQFLLILFVFVYLTIFICEIPRNFTFNLVEGHWRANTNFFEIVQVTNDKLISLAKLDLGTAGRTSKPLNYLVTDIMKNSLILLFSGLVLGFFIGIGKGILDSRRDKINGSNLKVLLTIIPISLPDVFIIALLQQLAVYLTNHGIEIFKVGGAGSLNHLLLPVIALSILPTCYIARITALAIEECVGKDYVMVAMGKGCSKHRILWNHIMRNAIKNIIASLPTITSILIGNLMMVEYLFIYPGLTRSLLGFYSKNENDGVILNVLLIGFIYFMLDAMFRLFKALFSRQTKEAAL